MPALRESSDSQTFAEGLTFFNVVRLSESFPSLSTTRRVELRNFRGAKDDYVQRIIKTYHRRVHSLALRACISG